MRRGNTAVRCGHNIQYDVRVASGDHVARADELPIATNHIIILMMMSLQARLQAASGDYQRLQADLSNAVEARQRLDAQLSENELVKKVRPSFYVRSTN
jgi:hypothetical protein